MSETPRVDAVHTSITRKSDIVGRGYVDMCDLACELERELAAKTAEVERLLSERHNVLSYCNDVREAGGVVERIFAQTVSHMFAWRQNDKQEAK